MPKRMRFLSLTFKLVATALCAAAMPGLAVAGTLSVCIDSSNPSAAMDRKIAAAVAATQGDTLATYDFDGGGDDDGYAMKNFAKMAMHDCDLVLGFPLDVTDGAAPAGLMATPPYAHVAFVLVTQRGVAARSLAELPKGTDVAVTYLTTPNLYFGDHPNVNADVFTTEAETLHSFVTREVKAAMLWHPTLVQYQLTHPHAASVIFHELTEPHARWNIVALYAPRSAGIAATFAESIGKLRDSGKLAKLVAPYAAPAEALGKQAQAEQPDAIVLVSSDAAKAPALYTQTQADAGALKFASNCAVCHGKDLTGMAGPALKGKNFASVKADFHVKDIFDILVHNMPATQPGSLPHGDYVEIMAFLLQQNGYPAGTRPLSYSTAETSNVPLIYRGQ